MLVSELIERVESTVAQLEDLDEYWGWYFGIRFENKERTTGEIITDRSKHNIDREDERDFPQFGSDEYEEMPELEAVLGDFHHLLDRREFERQVHFLAVEADQIDAGHDERDDLAGFVMAVGTVGGEIHADERIRVFRLRL